jgi:hypothetical protein
MNHNKSVSELDNLVDVICNVPNVVEDFDNRLGPWTYAPPDT